jgi:predicted MFS family arabinose efflux permease
MMRIDDPKNEATALIGSAGNGSETGLQHSASLAMLKLPGLGAGAWYTLGLLTLIYTCHAIDRSVMSIVIEPVKHEFNLSDSQLGTLTGMAYALTFALAGIPLGYFIDRVNRRNLLATMLAVWSACTVLCGLAQSYLGLVLARFTVGAAEASAAPTAHSLIGDLFPERLRSTAISIFWMSTALGTATSFIFGSVIAVQYGWRAAFFIAGLPGLLLAIILVLTVIEPVRGAMDASKANPAEAPTILETWRYASRQPLFTHAFIAVTLNSLVLSGMIVWIAAFLIRVHGLDLKHAGLIAGIMAGVFGGLGSFLGGPIGDYAFKKGGIALLPLVPALTSLVTAIVGVIFALTSNLYVALAAIFVFETISRTYTAPGYSLIISSVQPRMRGISVSALQIATNLIGYGLGPLFVGYISDLVGGAQSLRYGFVALMGFGVWASLHFFLAYRSASRTAADPAPIATETHLH